MHLSASDCILTLLNDFGRIPDVQDDAVANNPTYKIALPGNFSNLASHHPNKKCLFPN